MTTIFDIYNFVNFVTDKYRNGYLSPEEVSSALDTAQVQYWNRWLGERQNGNELALIALQPFFKKASVTTSSVGKALSPTRYAESNGVFKTISGVTVTVKQVIYNELSDALDSRIYPIASNPRFIQEDDGITIYPKEVQSIEWHYLARPNTPVIGYTNTANTVVYNPTTSTQLDFATQYWNDIILLTLPYIGVNLSNQEVAGLSELFSLNKDNGSGGN